MMNQLSGINSPIADSTLVSYFEYGHGLVWAILLILFILSDLKKTNEGSFKEIIYGSRQKFLYSYAFVFLISFTTVAISWGMSKIHLSFLYSLTIAFAIMSPVNAVSFFLFLIISRQWEFTNSNVISSMPQDFGAIMLISFFFYKFMRREKKLFFEKNVFLLIGYIILLCAGFYKTNIGFSSIPSILSLFSKILLFYLIAVDVIRNQFDLHKLKMSIVFAVLSRGILSLIYTAYSTQLDVDHFKSFIIRLEGIGSLGDPNDLASIVIMVLPIMYFSGSKIKNIFMRMFILVPSIGSALYLVWATRSRGALLALLIVLAAWFFLKFKNALLTIILAISISTLYFPLKESFQRDKSDLELSTANRLNYWVTGAHMLIKNPMLGVGYNMYPPLFEKYAPELKGESGERTAHSNWILVMAETGIIGFTFYMLFFFRNFLLTWKIRGLAQEYFLSALGYFLAISFLSQAYTYYPYIMICLCTCSYRVLYKDIPGNTEHQLNKNEQGPSREMVA